MRMVRQGFWVMGGRWYVMGYYGIDIERDGEEVMTALLSTGIGEGEAEEVISELRLKDSGFTLSDYDGRYTVMFVGEASSDDELYDSIQHELKHATEHIGEYFGIDPRGEESAYLQGEISRNMYKAVSLLLCPCCASKRK